MQARRYAAYSKLSSLPESLGNCTDLQELYVSSLPINHSDPPPPPYAPTPLPPPSAPLTRIHTLMWHTHILEFFMRLHVGLCMQVRDCVCEYVRTHVCVCASARARVSTFA